MKKFKRRVSNTTIFVWGVIAGTIDGAQAVLNSFVVGLIVNKLLFIAFIVSWYMFLWIKGISILNAKHLITQVSTALGEAAPAIDTFPLWTANVLYTLIAAKKEDDENEKAWIEEQKVIELELLRQREEQEAIEMEYVEAVEESEREAA